MRTRGRIEDTHRTLRMVELSSTISKITLNVTDLNISIKRWRLAEFLKRKNPFANCLEGTHYNTK